MFIALYSPTSVQRILDFQKTVYAFPDTIPIIIKPIGAAAQIGVPEAYRIAYKLNKSLIILPEISDLRNILGIDKIYYISDKGMETDIRDLPDNNIALVISGGEYEPSKKELEIVNIIKFRGIPSDLPAIALIGIVLYLLKSIHTM